MKEKKEYVIAILEKEMERLTQLSRQANKLPITGKTINELYKICYQVSYKINHNEPLTEEQYQSLLDCVTGFDITNEEKIRFITAVTSFIPAFENADDGASITP